jgi:hypothetical protein
MYVCIYMYINTYTRCRDVRDQDESERECVCIHLEKESVFAYI